MKRISVALSLVALSAYGIGCAEAPKKPDAAPAVTTPDAHPAEAKPEEAAPAEAAPATEEKKESARQRALAKEYQDQPHARCWVWAVVRATDGRA